MFYIYKTSYGGNTYFIYWLCSSDLFGVTDGVSSVFERQCKCDERAGFLNITESLLKEHWESAMLNKAFTIHNIGSDECILRYGTTKMLSLTKNTDSARRGELMSVLVDYQEKLRSTSTSSSERSVSHSPVKSSSDQKNLKRVREYTVTKRVRNTVPVFDED